MYRWCLLALVACQHRTHTPFPPGLTPLEDDIVPEASAPYQETLVTATTDSDFIRVYGRGYVLLDPGTVWAATQDPDAMVAKCSTDQQQVTYDTDPTYELAYVVAYTVNNVLTVQWDDEWRYGIIEGTADAPQLGMIKHQKIDGSSFIRLSEGTIEVTPAADDPTVTELAFVEHLDATGAGVDDVVKGTQHTYDAIVAVAHGRPIPACP